MRLLQPHAADVAGSTTSREARRVPCKTQLQSTHRTHRLHRRPSQAHHRGPRAALTAAVKALRLASPKQ